MASPVIKWAGGKRQLVPELLKHLPEGWWPADKTYYEPFVGGGALFFDLKTKYPMLRAHLNDANPHLINVYTHARDEVEAVIGTLGELDRWLAANGLRDTYAKIRHLFNTSPSKGVLPAAWFFALNAWGFNGLCRYNKSGGFNVPVGKFKKVPVLMDKAENLRAASRALADVEITCGSFDAAVTRARGGDLVYFDPPYIPKTVTSDFTSYTADGFNGTDQEVLRDCAVALVERGVYVILSNSDTPLTRSIYKSSPHRRMTFDLHEVQARRAVNCNAKKRGKVGELIIVGRP